MLLVHEMTADQKIMSPALSFLPWHRNAEMLSSKMTRGNHPDLLTNYYYSLYEDVHVWRWWDRDGDRGVSRLASVGCESLF